MKVRGSQKPLCKTCGHMFLDNEKNVSFCMLTKNETSLENACKKYAYDIFKYEPKGKIDFEKYNKHDFEI